MEGDSIFGEEVGSSKVKRSLRGNSSVSEGVGLLSVPYSRS